VEETRRRWFRRRTEAAATTTVCPRCNTAGLVRLRPGEECAACKGQDAWIQLGEGGLVIDRAMIDEAVRRRQGAAAGRPLWRRALVWIPPAVSAGLAALSAWTLVGLLSSRAIGPLAGLLAALSSAWKHALLAGLVALLVGAVALVRARRSWHFRRIPLLACHLAAITVGASALVLGTLHGLAISRAFGGEYASMPPRERLGVPTHMERILDAAVVVLASDADGDARGGGIGSGAVVAVEAHRAWIVTCSHVAIPYVTSGAPRRARGARPVWVQLSDGREGQATVKWAAPPPLDVVLLEMAIDRPPAPVPIALDASAMTESSPVTFVPNPYRSGWSILHGQVTRRRTHHTPAGAYDLVHTDLPLTPGDSGSGLYDARGQLVGLNTWRGMGDRTAQGISLPSEAMRAAIDAIRTGRLDQLDNAE
jgi:S1-C subfamily serine protease